MMEPCRYVRRLVQLRNGFDIDVERIAKEPADGAIRADRGPRIRQRVEGVDADERATESSRPPNEVRQVRQVANAPIPLAANGVEVGDEPESTGVAEQVAGEDAPGRHDEEHLLSDAFASLSVHMEPQP